MKKFFGVLFVLGAVLFASCDQIVDPGVVNNINNANNNTSSNAVGNGYGSVSVVIGSPAVPVLRSAMPTEGDKDNEKFTDIVLEGLRNGSSDTNMKPIASWSKPGAVLVKHDVEAGSWTFKLTAERFGTVFSQTLTDKIVADAKTTTLKFNALEVDAQGIGGKGAIEATIRVGNMSLGFGSNTTNTVLFTAKIDDGEPSPKKMDYIKPNYDTPYTFTAENVEAGKHLITFYVYRHRTNSTLPPEDLLLTFSEYVNVRAGYTSRMDKTMYDTGTGVTQPTGTEYTITYKANYPSGSSPADEEREFYKGDAILDASVLGFDYKGADGKRFIYWKDGSGNIYKAGETPALTGDITLTAQWEKYFYVYYYSNPLTYIDNSNIQRLSWKDTFYEQQYYSSEVLLNASTEIGFDSKIWSAGYDYMFCGWDTEPDGSGTRYAHGEKPTFAKDTKLYAQWCKKPNESEYDIKSARELNAFIGAPSTYVANPLASTIVLDGFDASGVTMISSAKTFNGTVRRYQYATKTITGLSAPLFKEIGASGLVKDIYIDKSTINGAGAIAETNAGTIEKCYVRATVTVEGKATDLNVGGMVGKNTGTITGGSVSATVIGGTEAWRVGGVAGWNTKDNDTDKATISGVTISNCKLVTKGDKAYFAADAVGINGTLENTASSVSHTGYGVPSVVASGVPYLKNSKDKNLYKSFSTVKRPSTILLLIDSTRGDGTGIIYKGNDEMSDEPEYYEGDKKKPIPENVVLYTGWKKLENDNKRTDDKPYRETVSLDASPNTYTFRLYSSNGGWGGDTIGTYTIILE